MPAWISLTALIQGGGGGGEGQCCASPQETNGLKDMDGLLTAALFLSLTSMLSNRAQRSWTLDDGVTFGFQLFYVHAHTVNLVVVCSASLLNYFTCEKNIFLK